LSVKHSNLKKGQCPKKEIQKSELINLKRILKLENRYYHKENDKMTSIQALERASVLGKNSQCPREIMMFTLKHNARKELGSNLAKRYISQRKLYILPS